MQIDLDRNSQDAGLATQFFAMIIAILVIIAVLYGLSNFAGEDHYCILSPDGRYFYADSIRISGSSIEWSNNGESNVTVGGTAVAVDRTMSDNDCRDSNSE